MSEPLQQLASALSVRIEDQARWQQAVTHPSYVNEHPDAAPDYERLEFLGDALIGAAAAELLFQQQNRLPPGEMTFLRSVLVRKRYLADWAADLPLQSALRMGRGLDSVEPAGLRSILADALEAVIAAVYLDHGFDTVVQIVRDRMGADIPSYRAARLEHEPKNVLQERLAVLGLGCPSYDVIRETADAVDVRVSWQGGETVATASSKRRAENAAARRAIDLLDLEVAS